MPLRVDPLKWRPWEGPALDLFGRLAPGVTVEQAQGELAAVGRQIAEAHPDGPDGFSRSSCRIPARSDLKGPLGLADARGQFLIGALSFLVAINLAVLLYARTIAPGGDRRPHRAWGEPRPHPLAAVRRGARADDAGGRRPGDLAHGVEAGGGDGGCGAVLGAIRLGPSTVLYAFGLAVVAALIMGVLPGLKATGQRLSANLQELHGRTGTRLGSMWSTLIVAQVAVAVAILPAAVFLTWYVLRMEFAGRSVAVDRIAVANMVLSDEDSAPDEGLVRQRQDALMSRLRGEPGVTAVTFSSAVPGLGPDRRIEFQPSTKIRDAGDLDVASFRIDVELLRVYEARLLAGRGFEARDVGAARAAIVNRTFVDDLLKGGGRSPRPERSARSSATRRLERAARRPTGTRSSASSTTSRACRAHPAPEGNPRCTTRWRREPRTRRAVDQIRRHAACRTSPSACVEIGAEIDPVASDAPRRAAVGVLRRVAVGLSDDRVLLAAIGLARRILRNETVEALRTEGWRHRGQRPAGSPLFDTKVRK